MQIVNAWFIGHIRYKWLPSVWWYIDSTIYSANGRSLIHYLYVYCVHVVVHIIMFKILYPWEFKRLKMFYVPYWAHRAYGMYRALQDYTIIIIIIIIIIIFRHLGMFLFVWCEREIAIEHQTIKMVYYGPYSREKKLTNFKLVYSNLHCKCLT